MNSKSQSAALKPLTFPDWPARLAGDTTLAPAIRESFRTTLTGFMAFCRGRQTEPTVAQAREYVEVARLAQAPGPARLAEWKQALNWFLRRGRAARTGALPGVPPLARTDLGGPAWEQALVGGRTEATYRGWLGRFARWLEQGGARPAVTGPEACPRSRR